MSGWRPALRMDPMRGYDEDRSPIDAGAHRDRAPVPVTEPGLLHLQRAAGNQATAQFLDHEEPDSPVLDVIGRGGGMPMDPALRGQMESSLGQDFGDVRVHTDQAASDSARAVGAQAYTVGNEIVFGSGRYDPASTAGQKTIAHELTHVVQQKAGPVDGTPAPGGISISDPGDRFEQEAERASERALQRQVDPEEEEMGLEE